MKNCIDCGKEVCNLAIRCKSCANRNRYNLPFIGEKIKLVCLNCKKEIEAIPSKNKQKFCSKPCRYEWEIKNNIKQRITLNCLQCGNGYELIPSKKDKSHFCSRKCHGEWMSLHRRGENHPMYGKQSKLMIEWHRTHNNPMLGKKLSPEHIAILKIVNSQPKSEEHKKKISISHMGLKPSEETKIKLKLAKQNISIETRKKMSLSQKGHKVSEETKNKLRKNIQNNPNFGMRGKHPSEETRKKSSATRQGIPLEKWENFKSLEPYDKNFNKQSKNLIRKRDNQICMNCGKHREKLSESLSIHHINYDKKCNIPQNFICLCRSCHMLTNGNREYWTKLFQDKLSKLYGYKYSNKGDIILDLNLKDTVYGNII